MITTVTGNICKEDAGLTLPHEHIFIDMRVPVSNDGACHSDEKLSLNNRYKVFSDPYALIDNAWYTDENVALKELLLYKAAGGKTICDASPSDIGRNPHALKRLSEQSGVNIVMGCGHYTDGAHPRYLLEQSVNDVADDIIRDLTDGVDGIKAGYIGEIGTSATVTENEWKVVVAAGIASVKTDSAIQIHTSLWERNGLAIIDKLTQLGVKPEKICIDHIDVDIREDYLFDLLNKGVYVEFDNFGKEFFMLPRNNGWLRGRFAYDLERCQTIARLIKAGYEHRILVTNDLCLRSMLAEYGGNGYAHLINNVMPMLEYVGISESTIKGLTETNPSEFLDK
jgi:phosphotriesterase-related protein